MSTQPNLLAALLTIRDASPPEAGLMDGVDTWSAFAEGLKKIAGDAVAGHDGAEEAGDCVSHRLFSEEKMLGGLRDWIKDSAPPKPAPDAMRSTLQFYASEWDFSGEGVCQPTAELFVDKGRIARDALRIAAAPVPPADEEVQTEKVIAAWRKRFPNNMYAWPGVPSEFALEAVRALSPSVTGAEPVAWGRPHVEYSASRGQSRVEYWVSREDGKLIETGLVNPTVRGDRESLTDLRNSFVEICRSTDVRSGSNDPYANRIANEAIKSIDAILSLPVQPGAGERDAVIMWLRSSLVSLMTLAEADPSPLTNKQVASICKVTLSRQAPHSSSEDGR